ncbi:MAG: peptide-methionine (S)-S-oxide reductase MsrA [Bacteroidota bacterium]
MTTLHKATLGGGCFWCVEAVLKPLRGVHAAVSGYAGGTIPNPTYREICSGLTGHAEVVEVTFDPSEIAYADLLRVFFATHDPTTLNRQGADVGTQYRSVVFTHSDEQAETAHAVIAEIEAASIFDAPIVTQVQPAPTFYEAEDYHQDYFARNPNQPYCAAVIAPKVAKFRKRFLDKLAEPA